MSRVLNTKKNNWAARQKDQVPRGADSLVSELCTPTTRVTGQWGHTYKNQRGRNTSEILGGAKLVFRHRG